MRRAFSLLELLVVIAILALLAALLFPVFAGAKRQGYLASATSRLRQIGVATSQYMADHNGHLPIRNYGGIEHWEVGEGSPNPVFDAASDPLRNYGVTGFANQDEDMSNLMIMCPGEGHAFTFRWVFHIRNGEDLGARPKEVRRIEPEAGSVLVRCPNLLTEGYQSSGNIIRFEKRPLRRSGRELLLRGDGSVSNVDTRTQRILVRSVNGGKEEWTEVDPATDPSRVERTGQVFEAFPGEPWPPAWTVVRRPQQEKP